MKEPFRVTIDRGSGWIEYSNDLAAELVLGSFFFLLISVEISCHIRGAWTTSWSSSIRAPKIASMILLNLDVTNSLVSLHFSRVSIQQLLSQTSFLTRSPHRTHPISSLQSWWVTKKNFRQTTQGLIEVGGEARMKVAVPYKAPAPRQSLVLSAPPVDEPYEAIGSGTPLSMHLRDQTKENACHTSRSQITEFQSIHWYLGSYSKGLRMISCCT